MAVKPVTDTEYKAWERTATRPFTAAYIGEPTTSKRTRDAELSRLMDGHERERIERVSIRSPWTGRVYVVMRQP